ncbi:MAG: hypothetical protein AAGC57_18700, partial [Pseudomonadota bacterium]
RWPDTENDPEDHHRQHSAAPQSPGNRRLTFKATAQTELIEVLSFREQKILETPLDKPQRRHIWPAERFAHSPNALAGFSSYSERRFAAPFFSQPDVFCSCERPPAIC